MNIYTSGSAKPATQEDIDSVKMDYFYMECFIRKIKGKKIKMHIEDMVPNDLIFESDGNFYRSLHNDNFAITGASYTEDGELMNNSTTLSGTIEQIEKWTNYIIKKTIKCECGGDMAGGTHSVWCPKHNKKTV